MGRKLAELLSVINGFRKFILMMLLLGVSVAFRVKGYISGGEFVDLLKATTLAFFSANGFEHMMETIQNYHDNKTAQAQAASGSSSDDDEPKVEG